MAGQSGYNAANWVTEEEVKKKTVEALKQLAAAKIADREAMTNLVEHISSNKSTAAALLKLQEKNHSNSTTGTSNENRRQI